MSKEPNSVEHRYLTQEFRVSDTGAPTISGYAALFGVFSEDIGGWTESIDPHAFDAIMMTNPDVRALWNHNPDHVLGRTLSGTLKLNLDSRGLAYVIDPPNTTLANDLIVSMRRKDVTQSSFGFKVKRDQWTEQPDGSITRRILEFQELLDISPVTYPAYAQTSSQARNMPSTMPAELRSKIITRSADDISNEPICECECTQCLAGACNLCSDDDCIDEVCSCYNQNAQRSLHVSDSEHRRLLMKLALLAHKH
ncbi:HK97 family phage prohead protease [Granulicella mallensis]|uniref:Phage prohead protease, HK97 family n=1 Tax=Granulicella mallensis (strain ATCC BAA-1857 / DSM 23137 / MP5ACTX8) TaxID=682795 RepID=G8NR95_GRAMM|nr:HK97 family phage prohead protease [Granulicella mallensis]AEU36173.1 phage prohead protease, HK97 family [Granulicella mallensis MP5ACTX8]